MTVPLGYDYLLSPFNGRHNSPLGHVHLSQGAAHDRRGGEGDELHNLRIPFRHLHQGDDRAAADIPEDHACSREAWTDGRVDPQRGGQLEKVRSLNERDDLLRPLPLCKEGRQDVGSLVVRDGDDGIHLDAPFFQ